MYQYKNHSIVTSDKGVFVYKPSGEKVDIKFVNEKEAEEHIDESEEEA